MQTVNVHEAKTNLSRLIEAVESGAEQEVIIARNGKPVARLTRIDQKPRRKVIFGLAKGTINLPDDFDKYDAHIEKLFNGEAG